MSIRRATVWVIDCDAPDCLKLAVPAGLRSEQREKVRRALHLSHSVDAFTSAEEAGWVSEPCGENPWKYYCPEHAGVPAHPRAIRGEAPALSSVVDMPLPAMPEPADR